VPVADIMAIFARESIRDWSSAARRAGDAVQGGSALHSITPRRA
jgi:hypothetical protein